MLDMSIFTPVEQKMLRLLAKDPKIGPTDMAKELGWKSRGAVPEAMKRLKAKMHNFREDLEFMRELGIKPEDVNKW